jgi:hypothetical protein
MNFNLKIYFLTYIRTYTFGNDVKDQQVGCLWSGTNILTVSLSGQISYLDREGQKPLRVIRVRIHWFIDLLK